MPITSAHRPNPDHDDHPDIHGSGDKRPERPYIRRAKSHQSRGLIDACLARESGHASTCDTAVVTPCSRAMGHPADVRLVARPTAANLVPVAPSWRLSLPTLPRRHAGGLDQWGIDFPIAFDNLAGFDRRCGRGRTRSTAVVGSRLRVSSQLCAYAALLMLAAATGGAAAVPSTTSARTLATSSEIAPVLVAVSTQTPVPYFCQPCSHDQW